MHKVKAGLSPSKNSCAICFIKRPLKRIKNDFHFILKSFFVLKIFKVFTMTFRSCTKNWLVLKDNVNIKIYDFTTWLTNNFIHKLANISWSKGNQTMVRLGQLIEYKKRNIFLQTLRKKWYKQVVSSLVWIYLDSPQLKTQ